ncbi:hypothetical protein DKX38_020299 [Salix brachista]|uniref:peroxidase n=1 Tax=Salix brachista TaxID=2182728 RepID=A0A5N5KIW7_9ROSI|nr:hypothetical protein DKX38_020299 [Salix brachista]
MVRPPGPSCPLSGHSILLARCITFRDRIYNDIDIDSNFAASLRSSCPQSGGDDVTKPLDSPIRSLTTKYFVDFMNKIHASWLELHILCYKLLSLISMATLQSFFLYFAALTAILIPVRAQLTPDFYDNVCPQALPTIRNIIKQAIQIGWSLVQGVAREKRFKNCEQQ